MHPLQYCGIPLGGIGAGTVELRPDGLFHEWQIMNNKPLAAGPEPQIPCDGAYFGCAAEGITALLNDPVDRLNDPYSFPYMEYPEIKPTDNWPFMHLEYRWKKFPVKIKLTAYSSFIPHDVKNSSLPGAVFDFEVVNTSDREIDFSFFHAQRNLTGYTQQDNPSVVVRKDNRLLFSRAESRPRANDSGTMAVTLIAPEAKISHAAHIKTTRDFWEPLLENNSLADCDYSETVGIGNAGAESIVTTNKGIPLSAIALTTRLKPGRKYKFTSLLTWCFPAFHELPSPQRHVPGLCIGHYYSNFFADADAVADYFVKELPVLKQKTTKFRKLWQDVSLPQWVKTAVTAQLPTLFKSSWLDRKGRFGIWEGLGLCGLQTIDVSLYGSFAVLHLFPELEKSQLSLTAAHSGADGHIPHSMPGIFQCGDIDDLQRVDLIPDFLLMLYRDVEWLGDMKWARKLWPVVKRAMEYFQRYLDEQGVVYDRGADQTYDQLSLSGTSAMTGFLQVASFKAAAKLALRLNYCAEAEKWAAEAEKVSGLLQERLWNGRWFSLYNNILSGVRNEGVMIDQCSGDWFLRQCGAEGIISDDQRRSVMDSILEYCSRDGFLANCSWPLGGGVKIGTHTSNQADWPWSGVEYAFAANLALAGRVQEALAIARDVFDRYERIGMRFTHIECGAHYYRAMSVWALYAALCGQFWNGVTGSLQLRFDHVEKQFLSISSGWGYARFCNGAVEVMLYSGKAEIRELTVITPDGEKKRFEFSEPVILKNKTQWRWEIL